MTIHITATTFYVFVGKLAILGLYGWLAVSFTMLLGMDYVNRSVAAVRVLALLSIGVLAYVLWGLS